MLVHSLLPTLTANSPRSAILPMMLFLLAIDSTGLSAMQLETETSNGGSKRGFVFLDGCYITPPYTIELKHGVLKINGYKLRATHIQLPSYYDTTLPKSEQWKHLHFDLQAYRDSEVTVLFRGREPMILDETNHGARLIRVLARSNIARHDRDEIPRSLRLTDRETWARLVSEFEPSPEFLTRAKEHLARLEEIRQTNANDSAQNIWLGRIEYPLTAFAMVIVALAFGHLMSTRPYIASDTASITGSPSPRQAVFRSLLIVVMLSVVDLIWTLAACDSGSMRELNPFGCHLIDRPLQLVAFKTATIAPAIGLLYWLHRSPIAQAASWWSCLVLTLVTARWLTFSSMFL